MEGPAKKRGFPFRKRVAEPEPESPEAREAREAAARLEEEKAARIAAIGAAWALVGERVRAALPSQLDHRQAYFLSLVRQGREAEEQNRDAVAAHCRACIDKGLAALVPLHLRAPVSTASAPSALSALKSRWDAAARARAAALLERHAARLAPAEREAYGASLEALSSAPDKSAQPLRRKLVERLLRAEAYRRRGARLSGWKKAPIPAAGPAGPYNDFVALEDMVRRVAVSHPEWAAEYLDLYGNMKVLRKAYTELLPKSKS